MEAQTGQSSSQYQKGRTDKQHTEEVTAWRLSTWREEARMIEATRITVYVLTHRLAQGRAVENPLTTHSPTHAYLTRWRLVHDKAHLQMPYLCVVHNGIEGRNHHWSWGLLTHTAGR